MWYGRFRFGFWFWLIRENKTTQDEYCCRWFSLLTWNDLSGSQMTRSASKPGARLPFRLSRLQSWAVLLLRSRTTSDSSKPLLLAEVQNKGRPVNKEATNVDWWEENRPHNSPFTHLFTPTGLTAKEKFSTKNLFCLHVYSLCNITFTIFNFQTFCVISQVKLFTDLYPASHDQLSKGYKRIYMVLPLWIMIYLIILYIEFLIGSYICLIVLPNCKEEIPPHACMKLPQSRFFKSGVQGEWSDTTISMWPAFSADHSCA